MNNVFLGIGSNLGNRKANIKEAVTRIEENIGPVIESSSLFETESWGFIAKNDFLNMIVKVETDLGPPELLNRILSIELILGRVRDNTKYISRLIDIDLLLYDDKIINEDNLKVPHPLMHERMFVLVPLNEIASDFEHPVFKKSIASLLKACKDNSNVKMFRK